LAIDIVLISSSFDNLECKVRDILFLSSSGRLEKESF